MLDFDSYLDGFEKIPVGVAIYEHYGDSTICVFANDDFLDLIGIPLSDRDRYLDSDPFSWVHPDDQGPLREEMEDSIVQGRTLAGLFRLHHESGQYRWTSVRAKHVMAPDGKSPSLPSSPTSTTSSARSRGLPSEMR